MIAVASLCSLPLLLSALIFLFVEKMRCKQKIQKCGKNFSKPLDKSENCDIIIKCIIVAFSFGGFLPFFEDEFVELHKKPPLKMRILL